MFTDEDRRKTEAIYAALFGPANTGIELMTWKKPFGEALGSAYYGVLDILLGDRKVAAEMAAKVAALTTAVGQVALGDIDMAAVETAARRGAESATVIGDDDVKRIAAQLAVEVVAKLPDGSSATAAQIADELARRLIG